MRIKKYDFPHREYADMCLSTRVRRTYSLCLCLFGVLFAVTIYMLFLQFEGCVLLLICTAAMGILTLWCFLCYYNIMLVMKSEEVFVYRTFLGNIYELRFDEIKKVSKGLAGTKIVFSRKRIIIDAEAITSERLRDRLARVGEEIENTGSIELPGSSEKTDQLRKRFHRHHR